MSAEYAEEERLLQEQFEEAERALAELQEELHATESDLFELVQRGHRFELVEQACDIMEELEALDESGLFWDVQRAPDARTIHMAHARRQIEIHNEAIAEMEARRDATIERIGSAGDELDRLHYDLRAAMARSETYKRQWIVERELEEEPAQGDFVMPWARGQEEDRLFQRYTGISVAVSLVLALIVSAITLPIRERTTAEALPDRVARLVRKEVPLPPPEPALVQEETPEPEAEPEPEVAQEEPPDEAPEVREKPGVPDTAPDSRERLKSKGILAFRESFAARANMRPSARLGSDARLSNAGEQAVGRPERSMVATTARGSSGGINLASISREVGGGGGSLEGVEVSRVASSIGGAEGSDRPLAAGVLAGRTDEEIQIVFDRYKAALYRLYNRELRKDPTLRGQMVLRLTIEPDGSVSMCELQSSDMEAPALAQQIVSRVSTFDFGAKEDVIAMTIIYPIDFLPSV